MTRLAKEREFHDAQAERRRRALSDAQLRFSDEEYLAHETWIRPAFAQLGDVAGLRVLDLGCGHGMAAAVLARRGAKTFATDLSGGYLAETRRRADANGVDVTCVQADAERLPFPSAYFDRVWANAVLHHLDPERSVAELHRVLRPGGWAVVCEPFGDNPLLRWGRRRWAYRDKDRTEDEEPLRSSWLPVLRKRFPDLTWEGHQLFGMARRFLGETWFTRLLGGVDRKVLAGFPSLRRYCRYVTFRLPRPPRDSDPLPLPPTGAAGVDANIAFSLTTAKGHD